MIPKKHASKLKNTTTTTTTASLFFRVLFLACVAAHANAYRYYGISLLVPINVLVFFDIFLSIIHCDDVHRPAQEATLGQPWWSRDPWSSCDEDDGEGNCSKKTPDNTPRAATANRCSVRLFFYLTFFSWIIKCSLFFSWKNILCNNRDYQNASGPVQTRIGRRQTSSNFSRARRR